MTALLRPALVLVALLTLLLGVAAPLALTALAGAVLPYRAGGSLLERDGHPVGSALLGQAFASPRYFQPRPSSAGTAGYDATASAASQLPPTSAALRDSVRERAAAAGAAPVPADAVTGSASGLDPHISPANAARQVARVAAARGLPEARVRELLAAHTQGRELGLFGEPRVNVLELNLALDALR